MRATVTNYIEAYYAGDAGRLGQTLHPITGSRCFMNQFRCGRKTTEQMLQEVPSQGPADLPAAAKTEQGSRA